MKMICTEKNAAPSSCPLFTFVSIVLKDIDEQKDIITLVTNNQNDNKL